MNASALTFDIDWAPDWAIAICADLCAEHSVPATFFATHDSPETQRLIDCDLFEVGIHPNFLPSSSHGCSPREIMDFQMRLVPNARTMRTHSLVQSTPMFAMVADEYPQIEFDASLLLPRHPNLQPVEHHLGLLGRRIIRIPYFWEDDVFAVRDDWSWHDAAPQCSGLNVFDFHPTMVALNIDSMDAYHELKAKLNHKPLTEATRQDFAPLIHDGVGDRTFLEALLTSERDRKFQTISEIGDRHCMETQSCAWL
jgi:Polysaccharide deacetylase